MIQILRTNWVFPGQPLPLLMAHGYNVYKDRASFILFFTAAQLWSNFPLQVEIKGFQKHRFVSDLREIIPYKDLHRTGGGGGGHRPKGNLFEVSGVWMPGFYKAFSHHHFVVNPFSNGHVPFPCNHCQMENRTNRKRNRGPNRNKVQHANCNGQPVSDKKLTV